MNPKVRQQLAWLFAITCGAIVKHLIMHLLGYESQSEYVERDMWKCQFCHAKLSKRVTYRSHINQYHKDKIAWGP